MTDHVEQLQRKDTMPYKCSLTLKICVKSTHKHILLEFKAPIFIVNLVDISSWQPRFFFFILNKINIFLISK